MVGERQKSIIKSIGGRQKSTEYTVILKYEIFALQGKKILYHVLNTDWALQDQFVTMVERKQNSDFCINIIFAVNA